VKTHTFRGMSVALMVAAAVAGSGCGGERPSAKAEPAIVAVPPPAAPVAANACVTACPLPLPSAPAPSTPAVAPQGSRAAPAAEAKISVKRLVLARGVKDREPVDPGTTFKSDARKVYAFVEIENRGRTPGEIVVEFEPPGGGVSHGDVTLAVGPAARWRTWAYTRTASTAGTWTAVVKDKKGDVLARAPFEVTL
jgi:Protein of unknown function (DUF2914)